MNDFDWRTFGKLLYVLALAVALFVLRQPAALGLLLAVQILLWFAARLPVTALWRSTYRLRLFFLFIVLSYAFLSTGDAAADRWLTLLEWPFGISVNLANLQIAALMCLRVLVLVLASAWLQRSAPPGALVGALRRLHLPETLAIATDASLALLTDAPGRGTGKGHRQSGAGGGDGKGRRSLSFRQLRRGELGGVGELLERSLQRARAYLAERYSQLGERNLNDLTVVLAVALVIMGLKVFQILPGIPIASGHKNLIVVPLLLFAASRTHARFGGLLAGSTVGIVSFLLGYGKYGILEIAHFALPGLLADLLLPWAQARSRAGRLLQYAVLGTVLGLGRFSANLLVILLAGSPQLAYLFFAPMLISQVAFGALSCFVTIVIVNNRLVNNITEGT